MLREVLIPVVLVVLGWHTVAYHHISRVQANDSLLALLTRRKVQRLVYRQTLVQM